MIQEIIDQAAHFVCAAAGVAFLMLIVGAPVIVAIGLTMFVAVVRELVQNDGRPIGNGSLRDLLFFLLGAITIAALIQ